MDGLDQVQRLLDLLAEGEPHTLESLSGELGWPEPKTRLLVEFLAEHGFISYTVSESTVRLDLRLRSLMIEGD